MPTSDNKIEIVRLFVENLMMGTVTMKLDGNRTITFLNFTPTQVKDALTKWRNMRSLEGSTMFDRLEFLKLTMTIYDMIESGRITGDITGQIRDFDQEKRIAQLEDDNKKLAAALSKANKENDHLNKEIEQLRLPPDNKNFRGVS